MNVVFLHPDLGIGGAERLVVDAALALQAKGHKATFVTGHHDRNHCFEGIICFLLFTIQSCCFFFKTVDQFLILC